MTDAAVQRALAEARLETHEEVRSLLADRERCLADVCVATPCNCAAAIADVAVDKFLTAAAGSLDRNRKALLDALLSTTFRDIAAAVEQAAREVGT